MVDGRPVKAAPCVMKDTEALSVDGRPFKVDGRPFKAAPQHCGLTRIRTGRPGPKSVAHIWQGESRQLERVQRLGRVWLGRVQRLGRVWLGRVWLGRVWLGRVWLGRVWLGRVWLGRVPPHMAERVPSPTLCASKAVRPVLLPAKQTQVQRPRVRYKSEKLRTLKACEGLRPEKLWKASPATAAGSVALAQSGGWRTWRQARHESTRTSGPARLVTSQPA